MAKCAFLGFGEVNTPVDFIIRKCSAAEAALRAKGVELLSCYPISDDYEEKDISKALKVLEGQKFDSIVICVAGWIPSHTVIKITEHYRHLPIILWGLCGWYEGDRLVTTADQAGTTALRGTFEGLGYKFSYFYDIIGLPSRVAKVAGFCRAASSYAELRSAKAGLGGYRDMQLYGTLYDGLSLKRVTGIEIECFELLEIEQRFKIITNDEKRDIVENRIKKWCFLSPAKDVSLMKIAGYYLSVRAIAEERHYSAISLKDVDGFKKLLGFPPAPVFMLLSEDGYCTIPENDSLGCVTQMIMKSLTGQPATYLEFYEFFEDRVLAGVPDFVPSEVVDGDVIVIPASFGELSEGILNVSKIKQGIVTMSRLIYSDGKYKMHLILGKGVTPRKWEECGWVQPAPQLPGLEILIDDVPAFAEHVASQHYIITHGDNRENVRDLCRIMGIEVQEI